MTGTGKTKKSLKSEKNLKIFPKTQKKQKNSPKNEKFLKKSPKNCEKTNNSCKICIKIEIITEKFGKNKKNSEKTKKI